MKLTAIVSSRSLSGKNVDATQPAFLTAFVRVRLHVFLKWNYITQSCEVSEDWSSNISKITVLALSFLPILRWYSSSSVDVFDIIARFQCAKCASEAPLVRKDFKPRNFGCDVTVWKSFAGRDSWGRGGAPFNVTCNFGCSQLIRFIYLLRSISR